MARDFTRIFFATDVHGSEKTFRKFLNAGKVYKVDVVMLCGDLTGKMVVPIVRQDDGTYHCNLFSQNYILKTDAELREVEERIANNGFYPFHATQTEMDDISSHQGRSDEIFKKLAVERVHAWVSALRKHLRDTGIKCILSPGNDDYYEVDDALKSDEVVTNSEGRVVQVDQVHSMITVGQSNMTPWRCPRDVSEEELKKTINNLAEQVPDMGNCIFNIHVPPINSGIDAAALLDDSVYPPRRIIQGGQPVMAGVGSTAVRETIEKYQPLLGLHGHIHESRGVAKIGRTVCLNPGSEYAEGILKGVIVSIADKKFLSYQFTGG